MIGLILVGHGQFAQGITSSLELIAGKQELYISLDFPENMTPDSLRESIKSSIDKLVSDGHDVIVLTDLLGATPFKESAQLSMLYDNVKVLAGTNLAMVLEASLMRHSADDVNAFANNLVHTGQNQVGIFDLNSISHEEANEDFEDGI